MTYPNNEILFDHQKNKLMILPTTSINSQKCYAKVKKPFSKNYALFYNILFV